ncbi:MAG TPA: hypothetical protein VFS13_00555 [Steroidobacteraceae bacterium]|nr:hypothetical protein [Steroidobacteraceae bacterium]
MSDEKKVVVTRRAGGVWEAAGTVAIIAGMVGCMATNSGTGWGGALTGIGVLLFLVGRFM